MSITVLVTGFGPFPGAPFNPTQFLVRELASLRRPILAGVKIVTHVFPTSYSAVDHDLPALIARHKPDALLMFGLATRVRTLRIETLARNAIRLLPDAAGHTPRQRAATPGGQSTLALPSPTTALLAAARATPIPVARSHDAGMYLCNYLCWRASETAAKSRHPRLAAFIHVPPVRRHARPRKTTKRRPTLEELVRTAGVLLVAFAVAARR